MDMKNVLYALGFGLAISATSILVSAALNALIPNYAAVAGMAIGLAIVLAVLHFNSNLQVTMSWPMLAVLVGSSIFWFAVFGLLKMIAGIRF